MVSVFNQFLINKDLFLEHKAHFAAQSSYSSLDLLYTHVSVCTVLLKWGHANPRKYPVAMAIPFKDMAQLTGTTVTSVFDGILKPPLFPNIRTGNDF